jgi:uncharacterized protein
MTGNAAQEIRIPVGSSGTVSGLLLLPSESSILYVLAHGAGAGMRHPFLEKMAEALAQRGVGTLRYQFLYMERGQRRPDPPALAVAAVRAAVQAAAERAAGLALIAGGKSFGGRMTSTAQSQEPLPGVRGLAFLGFPLHPPGKPAVSRADHLDQVSVPMLFVQGDRDEFAEPLLLRQVLRRLGERATQHTVRGGDHSFNVPKRNGRTADEVRVEVCEVLSRWAVSLAG